MKRNLILTCLCAFLAALIFVFMPSPARASGTTEFSEFPQEDAWIQAIPSVVWGGEPTSTTTLQVHIAKRKDVKRVWLADMVSDKEEVRMELFDDGTHGDKKSGDRVFTLSDVVPRYNPTAIERSNGYDRWMCFLRVELDDGTQLGNNYPIQVGIADPQYKGQFPVTEFGAGLSATPYAFFIQDSDHKVIKSYPVSDVYCGTKNYDAYRKLYSVYPDVFDFALLMPGMQIFRPKDLAENVPYSVMVSNKIQHIGLQQTDNTKAFGSAGRLKSVQYTSFGTISIQDHEIGHTWGMAIGSKLGLLNETYDVQLGHWNKMSDVQGQMGAYYFSGGTVGHFAYNGDETWRIIPNYDVEPYSPLELYLMGLIPSSEIPDAHILTDPDTSNPERVTAKSYKTITAQEIVKSAGGERVPSVSESQKAFNLAFIVTQDLPYNDAAYAYFSLMSKKLMTLEEPDKYSSLGPFYWATGRRATLNTDLGNIETLLPEN